MLGFALLLAGVALALWYSGLLAGVPTTWIVIGFLILAGLGIMAAARSPRAGYLR
jgi:hypothetical protein